MNTEIKAQRDILNDKINALIKERDELIVSSEKEEVERIQRLEWIKDTVVDIRLPFIPMGLSTRYQLVIARDYDFKTEQLIQLAPNVYFQKQKQDNFGMLYQATCIYTDTLEDLLAFLRKHKFKRVTYPSAYAEYKQIEEAINEMA